MTTVTTWMSISATGTKTLYFGADSQGTSPFSGQAVSLREKKVFNSLSTPEIFTLSGDLTWGASFLRRLLSEIGNRTLVSPIGSMARANEISALSCARPPTSAICELEVLYGVRSSKNMNAPFKLFRLHHSGAARSKWKVCQVGVDELASDVSTHVYSSGKGGGANKERQVWISKGDQGNVARTCFWSLCDLVKGIPRASYLTGGHPQLVKLDQVGNGNVVGVKYHGVPTVFGRRTTSPQAFASFWVDENFTQLDPMTLKKYSRGQQYGRRKNGR